MTISSIDTHAMVKQRIAVGFTDPQAEAVTSALRQTQDIDQSSLVTKGDLRAELAQYATKAELDELRSETKSEVEKLRLATNAELAETKVEIIKWVVGTGLAQAGFVVAMIKLMH